MDIKDRLFITYCIECNKYTYFEYSLGTHICLHCNNNFVNNEEKTLEQANIKLDNKTSITGIPELSEYLTETYCIEDFYYLMTLYCAQLQIQPVFTKRKSDPSIPMRWEFAFKFPLDSINRGVLLFRQGSNNSIILAVRTIDIEYDMSNITIAQYKEHMITILTHVIKVVDDEYNGFASSLLLVNNLDTETKERLSKLKSSMFGHNNSYGNYSNTYKNFVATCYNHAPKTNVMLPTTVNNGIKSNWRTI